jgi:IS1 family transposase
MNVLDDVRRNAVIGHLVEGTSQRATARLTNVDRETVGKLALDVGNGCAILHDRLVRDIQPPLIEIDECWSFLRLKQVRAPEGSEFGDQYTFVGMASISKLVISHVTDKRNEDTARVFAEDLRFRVLGRPQISSDGWGCYPSILDEVFARKAHYGQVLKRYAADTDEDGARRYSPSRIVSCDKRAVFGSPDLDTVNTSFIERQNLTLRMGLRRFTRLTNGFSKKLANHRAAIDLHYFYYNFCRIHQTTRVTPAMAEGLEHRVWSIDELVRAAIAANREPPSEGDPPPPAAPVAVNDAPVGRVVTARGRTFRVIDGGAP